MKKIHIKEEPSNAKTVAIALSVAFGLALVWGVAMTISYSSLSAKYERAKSAMVGACSSLDGDSKYYCEAGMNIIFK